MKHTGYYAKRCIPLPTDSYPNVIIIMIPRPPPLPNTAKYLRIVSLWGDALPSGKIHNFRTRTRVTDHYIINRGIGKLSSKHEISLNQNHITCKFKIVKGWE